MQEIKRFEESGMSRLFSKMQEHDTGTITAYRSKDRYTKKQNQERNGELLSKLTAKGYRVTSVKGSYIQDFSTPQAQEVTEHTFFVEDYQDRGTLKDDLIELGRYFDQDSVLFIPRLNSEGETKAVLIGTNHAEFPGYLKEIPFYSHTFGKPAEFMTKIGNRPFTFESVEKEYDTVGGIGGRWARKVMTERGY